MAAMRTWRGQWCRAAGTAGRVLGSTLLLGLLAACAGGCGARGEGDAIAWRTLAAGLELATTTLATDTGKGVPVRLVRVDSGRYDLELWNASEDSAHASRTARQWCLSRGGVAAINAGMYQGDGLTSVGLMRKRGHVNNPRLSRDRTVLLFDRRDESVPPVILADLTCDGYDRLSSHYHGRIQGIRMLGCGRRNVWAGGRRRHSVTAIGTDGEGRVVLVHCGQAVDPHSLVNHLRGLPIGLQRLMYLEGGPPAQLYVRAGRQEWEFGQQAGPLTLPPPPIPNVIVVRPREQSDDP